MRALALAAISAAALGTGAPPATLPPQASNDWSYTTLDLDVRIDPAAASIMVEGRARLRVESPQADRLTLGLNSRARAMRFSAVAAAEPGATTEVVSDSIRERAIIRFAEARPRGTETDITFSYRLHVPSSQLLITDRVALASWVEVWYPIPVPTGGAPRRGAPGTTAFDLPREWSAVSNGKRESSSIVAGRHIETWVTPVAVNRSFAAAPYTVARSGEHERDVAVYLIRADTASARKQAAVLARAITAMEAHFGPYPYPSYAIAEIPDSVVRWTASSEQGFIMVTAASFGADGNLPLFAHEAAHGWWGNLVNSAGAGARLMTESLAQYGAVLAIEAIEGKDAAADFLRFSRQGYHPLQSARGYFWMWRDGGDVPMARLADGRWDHNLSDAKGHWVYHMLRERVGDEVFFGVLRGFVRDFAGRPLTVDSARARFIAAAPRDTTLATFLHEWLDRTGAPVISYEWHATHRRADSVAVTIRQHGDLYHVPLELEIQLRSGPPIRHRVLLGDSLLRFTLPALSPVAVLLDPDHKLLFWRPEYGPNPLR